MLKVLNMLKNTKVFKVRNKRRKKPTDWLEQVRLLAGREPEGATRSLFDDDRGGRQGGNGQGQDTQTTQTTGPSQTPGP